MKKNKQKTENILRLLFIFFCLFVCSSVLSIPIDAQTESRKRKKSNKVQKVVVIEITEEERRQYAEAEIFRKGNQHDAAGELQSVGTIDSVPALIRVLEDNPPIEKNGKRIAVCTYSHALQALRKITGLDFGASHQAWENWWKEYKTNIHK